MSNTTAKLKGILLEYINNVNDSDSITEGLQEVISELEAQEPKEETFFDRLVKEKDELADKISKLESFFANKEKAIEISGDYQYELLCEQLRFCRSYHQVLEERIEDIESKSEGV